MSSDQSNSESSRRTFLKSAGALAGAGLAAGCTGQDGGTPTPRVETRIVEGEGGTVVKTVKVTDSPTAQLETFTNEAGVTVGANFDAVQELAADEKQAVFYSTVGLQEGMNDVKAGFNQRHPDARISIITGGSETLISRWTGEYQTDNVIASLFFSGSKIKRIWENNQNMKLNADIMPTWNDAPDKYKDTENNNWISVRQLMGSLFYNTDEVDEGAVTSWMDIVEDDRWSDQTLGWDPTPNVPLMSWLHDNFGREFFEKLRDQRPRFVDSHTDLARFTGAGEFPVSFTYTHKMAAFGNQLPVDYFPLDPMPSTIAPAVVNNRAPQPNSALLYLNYMNTEEGQNIIADTEMIAWRVPWRGYEGVFPNDNYTVETVPPSRDMTPTREMWDEVMGPILGG